MKFRITLNSNVIYLGKASPEPGSIISNEIDHFSMSFPRGRADGVLGFGTSINWDIAAIRRARSLIIADRSQDVILAHLRLYRPLFLACDTPSDFLASFAGLEPGDGKISSIFRRIRDGEPVSEKAIDQLRLRFERLVDAGRIEPLDMTFALEAVKERPEQGKAAPFSKHGIDLKYPLVQMFGYLYDPVTISRLTSVPRLFIWPSRFSFLGSLANYRHIKSLYQNDRIRFAIADYRDRDLYPAADQAFRSMDAALSDLYLSNILEFIPNGEQEHTIFLSDQLRKLRHAQTVWIYRTKGQAVPFRYSLSKLVLGEE